MQITHRIAKCQDCNWSCEENTRKCRVKASNHAQNKKHKVHFEQGGFTVYDYRPRA